MREKVLVRPAELLYKMRATQHAFLIRLEPLHRRQPMRQLVGAIALFTFTILMPAVASAQQRTIQLPGMPLSEVVFEMYRREINLNIDVIRALREVSDEEIIALQQDIIEPLVLTGAISNQLSTFPLGSSAGGFSWAIDTATGAVVRGSRSFGPAFAERALTVGRRRLNLGVTYQRATYDEFEGLSLTGREIKFYTPYLVRYGEDSLNLSLSTDTVGLFATYGITNRFDVGVAVPFVKVDLASDLQFIFVDPETGQRDGDFQDNYVGGGSAQGIGDVVTRVKYRLIDQAGGGLAIGADVRLPTGDEKNLLGIPGTQAKVYGIFSRDVGNFSPHVNVGYTFSQGNSRARDTLAVFLEPPDEFNYIGGVDFAITPRITVVGDLIGRILYDLPRLEVRDVGLGPRFAEFDLVRNRSYLADVLAGPRFDDAGEPIIDSVDHGWLLSTVLASVGGKVNVWRNLLVSGHVLVSLTKGGLRDKVTPVVGFDWSF